MVQGIGATALNGAGWLCVGALKATRYAVGGVATLAGGQMIRDAVGCTSSSNVDLSARVSHLVAAGQQEASETASTWSLSAQENIVKIGILCGGLAIVRYAYRLESCLIACLSSQVSDKGTKSL